jgi:predicted AAA+ superfamily ATPase
MRELKVTPSELVKRKRYLKALNTYLGKPFIKVLVGMRRTGKSSIIKLLIAELLEKGVPERNILYINKESLEFEEIQTYKDLYSYVIKNFKSATGQKYIFIDEVQEIKEWERAIVSFLAEGMGDIVISGSNSRLLSGELATLLSGRYVEIPVYPLTFNEFLEFRKKFSGKKELNTEECFKEFLKYGGLPGIHYLPFDDELVFQYLNSVLNTILYKDILTRFKIRDTALFDKIVKYLFDNIGNITTAKKIADYFKSQRIGVAVDTVLNYIRCIEIALLIKRVYKYDIKGKRHLEFYEKVYLTDIGLRNGLIGYRERDINGILENIVYNELVARGYKVYVGKLNGLEIDFVAEKHGEIKYIQVCYLLSEESTVRREFGNLQKIKDNYEKVVISLDKFFVKEIEGIKHRYLIDFLREEEF